MTLHPPDGHEHVAGCTQNHRVCRCARDGDVWRLVEVQELDAGRTQLPVLLAKQALKARSLRQQQQQQVSVSS